MAIEDAEGEMVLESIKILIERESQRPNCFKPSDVRICMVPDCLRDLNPSAYTPHIAAIGPLHRDDRRVNPIQEQKATYMYRLFRRIRDNNHDTVGRCVEQVFRVVKRARACYLPNLTRYTDMELAEMMVIDACFILELLLRFANGVGEGHDPILDNLLVLHEIKRDLVLLENQMPLFILEILFNITIKPIREPTLWLTDLILHFFQDMNILNNFQLRVNDEKAEHCHILGLLQSCYRARAINPVEVPYLSYSATVIARSGVTFEAHKDEKLPLTVLFERSSLLQKFRNLFFFTKTRFRIPPLRIRDTTFCFLMNLIAYEQCDPLSRHYVTSFALLMERLIADKDDVLVLVMSKVLHHNLADRDVAYLFKNICNGIILRDFYYFDELMQMHNYCNRCWPNFLIKTRRLYTSTLWKTLSVIGALVLFTLTLMQTIYSARSA